MALFILNDTTMNLGTLEFGTKINDQAVRDAEQIRREILTRLQNIDVNVNVKAVNIEDLRRQVANVLQRDDFRINLYFDGSNIENIMRINTLLENMKKTLEEAASAASKLKDATGKATGGSENLNQSLYKVSGSMRSGLNITSRYASGIAALFNVYAAKQFLSNIIEIGGQLEKQRVSMGAILGDVTKANVLFDQIKSLAIKSPFGVVELDQYTKQLAAYGFEYNELYDMVKRLADISAGAGQDIGRLTLALGHVKSQTYLTGITLRQFSMNNIPMLKMLADYYSEIEGRVVKVAEVQQRVSQRQVSYEDVIEQIKRLTDAGGMFYNMQEKISDTLAAKWKNLRDAFAIMYGELAESTIGDNLKNLATVLTNLTRHWRSILSVLSGVVGVWGTYFLITKSWIGLKVVDLVLLHWNALKRLRSGIAAVTAAQAIQNSVMKVNPYIAIASAIIALIGVLATFREKTLTVQEATQKYNEEIEKQNALMDENKGKAEMWAKILTNVSKSDKERNDAYSELLALYPNIFDGIDQETAKNKSLLDILKLVNAEYDKKKGKQASVNVDEAQKNFNTEQEKYNSLLDKRNEKQKEYDKLMSDNKVREAAVAFQTLNELDKQITKQTILRDSAQEQLRIAEETQKSLEAQRKLVDDNKAAKWFNDATEAAGKFSSLKPDEKKTWEDYFDMIDKRRDELDGKIKKLNEKSPNAAEQLKIYKDEYAVVDNIYKNILGGAEKQSTINKQESATLKKQREEFNKLKEIYSEYNKIKKDLGENEALVKVKAMFPDKIDATTENEFIENYQKALEDILNSTKDENLRTQVTRALFDLKENVLKENTDRALSIINEEIEKKSGQFNLYKSIFEKTGDKNLASQAFSNGKIWDDLAIEFAEKLKKMVNGVDIDFDMSEYDAKEHFKGITGAYELWKKIVDIISNNYKDALNKAADATESIMSIEDQIKKKEQEIEELRNRDDGFDYTSQIEQTEREITKLKGELFTISPEFQEMFKDTTDMSIRQINALYGRVKDFLNMVRNGLSSRADNKGGELLGYWFGDKNGKEKYIPIEDFKKLEKQADKLRKKATSLSISFQRLWKWISGKDEDNDGKADWTFKDIAENLADVAKEAASSAKALGEMFDSFGEESVADALELTGDLLDGVSDISKGIAEGNPFAVINGIASAVTSINKFHDKKLDKSIQKSQLEVKKLENAYKNLQYAVGKQLTMITKEQSSTLLKNLEQQRRELQKQAELEDKKKKTDKDKIADYQQQIEELNHEIADFYEELASDRYDASIDSWADKISDAITDAFASGEDAAKAFNDTVADIMKDVVSNIIKIGIVKPAMDKLQEYLFGANGIATTDSEEGVEISANEAAGLVAQLAGLKDTIGQAQDIWNIINNAAKQAGVDMAKSSSSSSEGLSKGIQGMTENTADLLASYLNAIRADVSQLRLLQEGNGTNPIAQAQLQNLQTLVSLAQDRNTRIGEIYDILSRAKTDKSFGFYVR